MRFYIYLIRIMKYCFCILWACFLCAVSPVWAQGAASKADAAVSFDELKWNFGDVAEDGGSVEHTFSFVNRSSKPVVILDVTTGCGCTTPTYSRKPVMSGGKGEIVVSFDPMNRPGHFSKGVAVLTSASKEAVTLTVEGVVIPRVKSTEELYPFDMGGGVRFDSNFRAFAYVGRGGKAEESIGWINTSSRDVRLSLDWTERSGMLHVEAPEVLRVGASGRIRLSYEIPAGSDRYGTLNDVLAVYVDGRKSRTAVSVHAIAVDKYDNAVDDMSSPVGELSKKFIQFGDVKRGGSVADVSAELLNKGDNDLIVRAVEWQSGALGCSLKAGDRIPSGGRATVKLTLDTSDADYGVWVDRLRIITNDPARPMQTLRITAIVVD